MAPTALWLADYQLLAAALLLGVMLALAALRQPAQRLAVAKSTLAALAALALLCAVPGWSLVHLLSESPTPIESVASTPIETPSLALSNPLHTPPEPSANSAPPLPNIEPNAAPQPAAAPDEPINWSVYLIAAYATGSAAVTLWLITGALLARRVRQQATPAPLELQELLQQICGPKKTPPQLLFSHQITAPVALGIRRPTILLPSPPPSKGGARGGIHDVSIPIDSESRSPLPPSTFPLQHSAFSLPPSQLLPILAHEWAHLQHRDLHTLAATRLLLILLWPQPLYWLLRRTIRLDQETLADAAAADRAGRLDYAQQLLAWASSASTQRPPRLAGAVGLWEGPSQLKRRIALLLNEQFNVMRSCSRRWRGGSLATVAVIALSLSVFTLQPLDGTAEEAADASTLAAVSVSDETASPSTAPTTNAAMVDPLTASLGYGLRDDAVPNMLRGRCLNESDEPIEGVELKLYRGNPLRGPQEMLGRTTTNADGEFEFRDVVDPQRSFPDGDIPDRPMPDVPMLRITVRKDGRASREILAYESQTYREGRSFDVLMPVGVVLSGIIKDQAGSPIEGARVAKDISALRNSDVFTAMTDSQGRFAINDLTSFDLDAQRRQEKEAKKRSDSQIAAEAAPTMLSISLASQFVVAHPDFSTKTLPPSSIPGNVEVTLSPGVQLRGRVVYSDGSSAPNATVYARPSIPKGGDWGILDWGKYDRAQDYQITVQTDAEGRFEATSVSPGRVDVWAELPGWLNVGIAELDVKDGQPEPLPDLTLIKGAVVQLQLIDDETGRPIVVDEPLTANNVSVVRKEKLSRRDLVTEQLKVTSEGIVEITATPGIGKVVIQSIDAGATPAWLPADPGFNALPQVEIVDGQTVNAEFRVRKAPTAAAEPDRSNAKQSQGNETAARMESLVKKLTRAPNIFMGYCVDETGRPLAGIDVSLFVYEASDKENVEPIARTKSGVDGRFEFNQPIDVAKEFPNGVPDDHLVEPPVKLIAAVAQAMGRTTEFQNDSLHAFAKRGQADVLRMAPSQTLTGRVTDDKGQPVANAIVSTGMNSGGYVPNDKLRARTDAEGRYVIDDLPRFDAAEREREYAAARERKEPWAMYADPNVLLSVQHPDFATRRANVKTIPGELDVTLIPGATIKGRVVARAPLASDAPRPLGNIPVWIMRTRQPVADENASYALVEQQQGMTDADGNYSFSSLPASEYAVTATAPNLTTVGVKGIEVGVGQTSTAPDVVLSPGAILRVKLVDGKTKEPLKLKAGQKGYVLPQRLSSGSIEAPRMDSQMVAFTANGVGETRLAPGRYNLFVSIPGEGLSPNMESHSTDGKSTVEELEVSEGETLELDVPLIAFPLQQASGVTATLAPAGADGAAVETQAPPLPATGHFQPLMSPADGDQPSPVPLDANPSKERDIPSEDGANDSSPNPYEDQSSPVNTSKEKSPVKSLKVQVLNRRGEPVVGAVVTPTSFMSTNGSSVWPNQPVPGWSEPQPQTTDAEGRVTFAYDVPKQLLALFTPQDLLCRVEHPNYVIVTNHDAWKDGTKVYVLDEGAIIDFTTTAGGETLPAEGSYLLNASSQREERGVQVVDGRVRLPRIDAGAREVRAVHIADDGRPLFSPIVQRDFANGETQRLELPVEPGVRVEGQLEDAVPRPVKNGRVIAVATPAGDFKPPQNAMRPSWSTSATINEDGTFVLEDLPAGDDLKVIALCDGYFAPSQHFPETSADPYILWPPQTFSLGDRVNRLTLKMAPTATCEIEARDEQGQPVADAQVVIHTNVIWHVMLNSPYGAASDSLDRLRGVKATASRSAEFTATTNRDGVATITNVASLEPIVYVSVQNSNYRLAPISYALPFYGPPLASLALKPGQTARRPVDLIEISE